MAERVARDVPPFGHVIHLTVIVEVFASRRTDDGKAAELIGGNFIALFIEHGGTESWNGQTCGTGSNVVIRCRNEDVQHFRRTNTVDELQACLFKDFLPNGCRQVFSCRDRTANPFEVVAFALSHNCPVRGRGGEEHGDSVSTTQLSQFAGCSPFGQQY